MKKNTLTFKETCKLLKMTREQLLNEVKAGKLNVHVKRNGSLRRFRIDGWDDEGNIFGQMLDD